MPSSSLTLKNDNQNLIVYKMHCILHVTASVDDCVDINCHNGTCMDDHLRFSCSCDSGYTGEYCEGILCISFMFA